jgi:RNA polymerase sigma-70 factor (ECF subfamily)
MYRGDKSLVKRMLAGREEAFNEFFDAYFPSLFRFALTRVRSNEDAAEEVAQATLCKAITKLHTYRGEASLFTWLCTFCRHEVSAYYRNNRVTAEAVGLIEEVPEIRAALESAGADLEDPAVAFDRGEIARLARVALDQLSPRHSRALEWKYLEGLPVQEIARRLNVSPKAAESVLTRARESFRDLFKTLTRDPLPASFRLAERST